MATSPTTHNWVWIALAISSAVAFIVCQILSFLSMGGDNIIFQGSTGNISDLYSTEITPSGSTFAIWGVIYIFLGLWAIHLIVSIFRKSANGGPLYKNPEIVSPLFMAVFVLNMCLNVTWLILWDRILFVVALIVLVLITLTLYVILVDYYRRINRNVKIMAREHKVDLILFRIFLQNGFSTYASWVSIASLLNLTIVLVYEAGVSQQTACLIALSVLTLILAVFVVLDWVVLERYMRYTFSTYLTVMWALYGSISANWNPAKPHSIFSVVLIALTAALFVGKIILTIINSKRNPLYLDDVTPTKDQEVA